MALDAIINSPSRKKLSMSQQALVQHLVYLINGGGAHISFEDAVANLPPKFFGKSVPGVEHTLWRQLEHLRICQWDILEFSRNPNHVSPEFPVGYWPATDAPPTDQAWSESVQAFLDDRREMVSLISDPDVDLYAKIPHGTGQTLLREALLVADHNAYHLGQIVILRKALNCWQ